MLVNASTFASTQFDYIVVGGGTAGLVVAARYVPGRLIKSLANATKTIRRPQCSGRNIGSRFARRGQSDNQHPRFISNLFEAWITFSYWLPRAGLAGSGIFNDKLDWCFKTIPQPGCNNREIVQPRSVDIKPSKFTLTCLLSFGLNRGKVLGGCSAVR